MATLVQNLVFSQAEVLPNGVIQVRMDNQIQDTSTTPSTMVLMSNYERHVIVPGQDYSTECDQVKTICAAVHTNAVITAYQAALAAEQAAQPKTA